jgi:hypothetical protein
MLISPRPELTEIRKYRRYTAAAVVSSTELRAGNLRIARRSARRLSSFTLFRGFEKSTIGLSDWVVRLCSDTGIIPPNLRPTSRKLSQ